MKSSTYYFIACISLFIRECINIHTLLSSWQKSLPSSGHLPRSYKLLPRSFLHKVFHLQRLKQVVPLPLKIDKSEPVCFYKVTQKTPCCTSFTARGRGRLYCVPLFPRGFVWRNSWPSWFTVKVISCMKVLLNLGRVRLGQSGIRIIGIMQVSVRLAALPIPEYLDFHSGYSAPRNRIAGIYSRIYSYSRIFPNERAPKSVYTSPSPLQLYIQPIHPLSLPQDLVIAFSLLHDYYNYKSCLLLLTR